MTDKAYKVKWESSLDENPNYPSVESGIRQWDKLMACSKGLNATRLVRTTMVVTVRKRVTPC